MRSLPLILLCVILPFVANGQGTIPASSRPSEGNSSSGTSAKSSTSGNSNFLGKDVPFFDPSAEMITWDGKTWNVNDNRIFRARFEKYLNAPEETGPDDAEYNAILNDILDLLQPMKVNQVSKKYPGKTNLLVAFGMLYKASEFSRDAHLSETIANAVYAIWLSKDENERIDQANKELEDQKKVNQWNLESTSAEKTGSSVSSKNATKAKEQATIDQEDRAIAIRPYQEKIVELTAKIKANELKKEAAEVLARLQFQSLLLQLFVARRFQHVTIGTRFYRAVFNDGNTKIEPGADAKKAFANISGGPPTLDVLDSLSTEAMRDVKEGVDAFQFLIGKNEMASASQRLSESFMIGEFLPEIRTLPREKKRQALSFAQKYNELLSSLEVKDYENAERLVKEIKDVAKDFDATKPIAAIETARTTSRMHLAKAINAAGRGDAKTLEDEIKEAATIWPRNPELQSVSQQIFSSSNVQNQALMDLDRLLQQKNYREIDRDKGRYLIATAQSPEKTAQLQKVLENVASIRGTIIKSEEVAKRGDFCGAWETVETVFPNFPDDNELNQLRSTLTVKASAFVNSLSRAKELEDKNQLGSSLAWYLEAKRIYPTSEFANKGIGRIVHILFPGNKDDSSSL